MIVLGNVSIVTVPDAGAIFGIYGQGDDSHPYTTVVRSLTTITETIGEFSTDTLVFTNFTDVSYTTVSIPSAIPTTLLSQSMAYYQQ